MKGNENKDETTQFLHIARKFMATEREEKKAENDCAHTHMKNEKNKMYLSRFFRPYPQVMGHAAKTKSESLLFHRAFG